MGSFFSGFYGMTLQKHTFRKNVSFLLHRISSDNRVAENAKSLKSF